MTKTLEIAKKYVDPVVTFDELVSDGNESLIRAVEKFDYARGFRFSTYATWAIRRNFFRQITDRRKRKSRFLGSDEAGIEDRAFTPDADELNEREYESIRGLMGGVIDRLSERERQIVRLRYGLDRETRPHTLQQIGVVLGVSAAPKAAAEPEWEKGTL